MAAAAAVEAAAAALGQLGLTEGEGWQEQQQRNQQQQQQQDGEEGGVEPPEQGPVLLQLPTALLALILGQFSSAADLARCAAACGSLRRIIAAQQWEGAASLRVSGWSPGLEHGLRWAVACCPSLRAADLSGLGPLQDAQLAPLAHLTALTSLALAGCWRITGLQGSPTTMRGGDSVLGAVLSSNRQLVCLDLSGTAVVPQASLAAALSSLTAGVVHAVAPAAGLQHLSLAGCRGGGAAQGDELRSVLLQCPSLHVLDLPGCSWLTADALPQLPDVRTEALCMLPIHRVSFAGCELLTGIGWLLGWWEQLRAVDLSGTSVSDADVAEIADGCPRLQRLNLSGCCRIKGPALLALAGCQAMQAGCLVELRLADAAWVTAAHVGPLLRALQTHALTPVTLDLSSCGGLNDATLMKLRPPFSAAEIAAERSKIAAEQSRVELGSILVGGEGGQAPQCVQVQEASDDGGGAGHTCPVSSSSSSTGGGRQSWCAGVPQPPQQALLLLLESCSTIANEESVFGLAELRLAGCSRVSARTLQMLAGARDGQLLRTLCCLDLSHAECMRGSSGGPATAPPGSSNTGGGAAALTALLAGSGPSLRSLSLDGRSLGGGVLQALAAHCPNLSQLSLVGCRGLTSADLQACGAALCVLRSLALGGPALSWREEQALTGFSALTSLRIARRPFLTDAQLAPLLAANRDSLRELALASCAALTDAVLLPLVPGSGSSPGGLAPHSSGTGSGSGLRALQLVCCERLSGATCAHLRSLRTLRLSGCPAITEAAVQAAAVCCTQLTLLELPAHLSPSCLPVAAAGTASHLFGIRIVGGGAPAGGRLLYSRRRRGG